MVDLLAVLNGIISVFRSHLHLDWGDLLIVLGAVFSTILAYFGWRVRRKRIREEKFENVIQEYGLLARSMDNSSIYENFTVWYTHWDKVRRAQWLKDHGITEIKEFYKWMDSKAPGWDWLK